MLNKVSSKLAKRIADGSERRKEAVYTYGIEIILSTMIGISSILIVSGLLHEFKLGVIFLLVFAPLRVFTGGYHAVTYFRCFLISNGVFDCDNAYLYGYKLQGFMTGLCGMGYSLLRDIKKDLPCVIALEV